MKFVYEYKTSENERRTGEVSAASRDEAYARLKRQGIRPFRVDLAPGALNRLLAIGKRGLAIVVLVAVSGVLAVMVGRDLLARRPPPETAALSESIDSPTRRQVIGDTAIIEKGIRTGWDFVFNDEGERFFASFAIPGVPAGKRNTTEEEIRQSLTRHVRPDPNDTIEARQIKCMVEGMKEELRRFCAAGGSIVEYGQCLVRRQEEELGYYNRARQEVERAIEKGESPEKIEALLDARNLNLRQMGIRRVSLPE